MPYNQTQNEWEQEMSVKILDFVRSELYLDLRFFDLAFSVLIPTADSSLQTIATDGIYLKYCPEQILQVFQDNPRFLNRAFLHTVLHCIFSHLWLTGRRDRNLWNISCDIAVEYTIDTMDKPCTRRILSWTRQQMYENLATDRQGISAAIIYRMLKTYPPEQLAILQAEFYTDDHCYWPVQKESDAMQRNVQNHWDKIARQTTMQRFLNGNDMDKNDGPLLNAQIRAGRSRRTYRDFLKKFTMIREEMHCDPDEFDLNFYTYGFRIYGSMPLIEPVETREVRKIYEFIIVIDTSDSTSGQLVKNFLQETFQILNQTESFFAKCKIRILQCDDQVRMDQEVGDLTQFESLLDQFVILGGGGTDFCPAFTYVEQLIAHDILKKPNGLLYFTDGLGTYPQKCPPYPTAFLFLEDYNEENVPPWAMRLKLEPEEFSGSNPNSNWKGKMA